MPHTTHRRIPVMRLAPGNLVLHVLDARLDALEREVERNPTPATLARYAALEKQLDDELAKQEELLEEFDAV